MVASVPSLSSRPRCFTRGDQTPAVVLEALEAELDDLLNCMCAAHAEETGWLVTVYSVRVGYAGGMALSEERHRRADGTLRPELIARWRRMTNLRPSEAALFWETFGGDRYRISIYPRTGRPFGTVSAVMSALAERSAQSAASVGTTSAPAAGRADQ